MRSSIPIFKNDRKFSLWNLDVLLSVLCIYKFGEVTSRFQSFSYVWRTKQLLLKDLDLIMLDLLPSHRCSADPLQTNDLNPSIFLNILGQVYYTVQSFRFIHFSSSHFQWATQIVTVYLILLLAIQILLL